MTTRETIDLFDRYVIGNYRRSPVCLVRGEGSHVWDSEGTKYLDFFPGWGCGLLGHCPPRVVKAVQEQVAKLISTCQNTWYTWEAAGVAGGEGLVDKSGIADGQVFFCNSGTEANEAAIKMARLVGKPKGRYKIIATLDSFHGRTFGALSATGQPRNTITTWPSNRCSPGFRHAPLRRSRSG